MREAYTLSSPTVGSPTVGPMAEQDTLAALRAENARLVGLLEAHGIQWRQPNESVPPASERETSRLSTREKVALFRRLFRGRDDVFPVRWENKTGSKSGYTPACANEWRVGLCDKPRIKCADCGQRVLIPLTDTVIDEEDQAEPWKRPEPADRALPTPMPKRITMTLADRVYFEKAQLPQPLANRLTRLAAFQNPAFYRAQAMRLSVCSVVQSGTLRPDPPAPRLTLPCCRASCLGASICHRTQGFRRSFVT